MKISKRFKILMVAAAALFMSAAPAYSWTQFDEYASPYRVHHQRYYHTSGRPYHLVPGGVLYGSGWYPSGIYDPTVRAVAPFGFFMPGVSIYLGW